MSLTLYDATELFLADYEDLGTLKSYRQATDRLLEYFGKDKLVASITKPDMKSFDQWFKKRPANTKTKLLSPYTIGSRYKTIKTFFDWLVELEEIASSPAKVLKK